MGTSETPSVPDLAGHGIATRDCERSIEGSKARRVSVGVHPGFQKPHPQSTSGQRERGYVQGAGVGRIQLAGECIEHCNVLRGHLSRTSQ